MYDSSKWRLLKTFLSLLIPAENDPKVRVPLKNSGHNLQHFKAKFAHANGSSLDVERKFELAAQNELFKLLYRNKIFDKIAVLGRSEILT